MFLTVLAFSGARNLNLLSVHFAVKWSTKIDSAFYSREDECKVVSFEPGHGNIDAYCGRAAGRVDELG